MALRINGKHIRIRVQYRGQKVDIKWPEAANEASIRAAQRASDRIKRDLEDGAFKGIEDYLPGQTHRGSFGEVARRWIKNSPASVATRNEYRKILNRYWLPQLGNVEIAKIKPSGLRAVISDTDFPSAKTKNNALIPLRQILRQAYIDEFSQKDLSAFVKGDKFQRRPPDPFSREEAERIIEHFRGTHFGPYFEFMFFTGLRTGEGLGLRWSSVDIESGVFEVQESQSKGRHLNTTKTRRVRTVRLNARAKAAIEAQRGRVVSATVFVAQDGEPYVTEKAQRAAWTRALKELGIRHRPQYNTRHSFISWSLMAGVNVFWLASQVGNSPEVIYKHYAKWINSEDDKKEAEKIELAAVGDMVGQSGDGYL